MIRLTRLNSQPISVNSDLIMFVESNPDTVITLVNEDKILVHESVDEVIARIIEFRRSVLAGLPSVGREHDVALATGGSLHGVRNLPPAAEEPSRG